MKSMLLVVDLQRGFINSNTARVIPVVEEAKKHLKYDICVFTQFYNNEDTSFKQILNWGRFQSLEEQELVIKPSPDDFVISKDTYSSVTAELKNILSAGFYDTVYICGVDTDSCVLATAFELFDNGIKPIIITDACASSRGSDYQLAAELIMRRSFEKENVNVLANYIGGDK